MPSVRHGDKEWPIVLMSYYYLLNDSHHVIWNWPLFLVTLTRFLKWPKLLFEVFLRLFIDYPIRKNMVVYFSSKIVYFQFKIV